MIRNIHEFIGMLRDSGIRISVSEALDCLGAINHVDMLNKKQFYSLLKSTLIKRREDIEDFDRIFRLYFEKYENLVNKYEEDEKNQPVYDLLDSAEGTFSRSFGIFIKEGAAGIIPELFRPGLYGRVPGMGPGMASFLMMRANRKINDDNWQGQLERLLSFMIEEGFPPEEINAFREDTEGRMLRLNGLLTDFIANEKKKFEVWKLRTAKDNYLKKDFGTLSSDDLAAIRETVQKLVRRLKDEYALRQKRRKSGKLDVKQTLRRSLQFGGLPLDIFLKRKNKSKGKIVALCDVSSSVTRAVGFMLSLLYMLQDQFSKVRSFVFVSDIDEVTEFFEEHNVELAIHEALNSAGIRYYSKTSYSEVLQQFYDEYSDIVNARTTLIIIGDARNNYLQDTNEKVLAKLKSKARRVIWLNPERQLLWGSGDSVIYTYKKYCHETRECWNITQLMDFVEDLVL